MCLNPRGGPEEARPQLNLLQGVEGFLHGMRRSVESNVLRRFSFVVQCELMSEYGGHALREFIEVEGISCTKVDGQVYSVGLKHRNQARHRVVNVHHVD